MVIDSSQNGQMGQAYFPIYLFDTQSKLTHCSYSYWHMGKLVLIQARVWSQNQQVYSIISLPLCSTSGNLICGSILIKSCSQSWFCASWVCLRRFSRG